MINKQKSGDKSINLQSSGDINIGSTALYSIEEVAKELLNSAFGELPTKAKKQIKLNQKSYFQILSENLKGITKQGEDLKKIIDSPDFQYVSKATLVSASRSSSIELHKNLSSLTVQRINNDGNDLQRIVYNEAITTIGKLTEDQLKIITLCYLLRYTSNSSVISWETYNKYFDSQIKPFMGFKNTAAEFQHIEYTGCGSVQMISGWSFSNIHRQEHSILFLNLVEKKQIDELNLPEKIKREIISLHPKEDKYFIRFKNKTDLEKYLEKKKIDEKIGKKFVSIYENSIKNKAEIEKEITEKTSVGKDLFELFDKSNIKHLSLTSVGIVIGASYFEQTVGEKIDISIWIN